MGSLHCDCDITGSFPGFVSMFSNAANYLSQRIRIIHKGSQVV